VRNPFSRFATYLKTLEKINSSNLNPKIKKEIKSSWVKLSITQLKDNSYSKILGYRINYLSSKFFRYLFDEIFINLEYYLSIDKKNPKIIDCGSNIGMSILFFKKMYPEADILAFEPDIEAFKCAQSNIQENSLKNVNLINAAILDKDGEIPFFFDDKAPGSLCMSTNPDRSQGSVTMVKSLCLSPFINSEIDFLKMDIEGAENLVLPELYASGKLMKINRLAIEYHHHINKEKDRLSEFLNILEMANFGYQLRTNWDQKNGYQCFQDVVIYAYRKK
jgi:FkbM family methyltransferase